MTTPDASDLKAAMRDGGKVAFLDFDGTLSNGWIALDFLRYLTDKGVFPRRHYGTLDRGYLALELLERLTDRGLFPRHYSDGIRGFLERHGSGEKSYNEFCERWGTVWASGLRGKSAGEITEHAKAHFEKFEHRIYESSRGLIDLLKTNGYRTIMVTVGPEEIDALAAAALGMDGVYATRLESRNGIYTGKLITNLHLPHGKAEVLDGFEGGFDFGRSMAFGNSISDRRMLERVGMPVALNPDGGLRTLAENRNWPIFTHEDVLRGVRDLMVSSGKQKHRLR